jgi:hypothetical protein
VRRMEPDQHHPQPPETLPIWRVAIKSSGVGKAEQLHHHNKTAPPCSAARRNRSPKTNLPPDRTGKAL